MPVIEPHLFAGIARSYDTAYRSNSQFDTKEGVR